MNKNPITKGLIVDWEEASKKASALEEKIVDRLDYIITTIFEVFKERLDTWYFSDAQEGTMGSLTYDEPEIFMEWKHGTLKDDMIIIDRDGNELMFDQSVPTRWLFQEFEAELKDGKKKYEERESAKLVKKLSDKEATKKLAASAKSKLTKEELAALKKSL